jgi:hypothetical protein
MFERLEARDIGHAFRVDLASGWVDWKQNGALKSKMLGEDFSKLWKRLFASIFMITRNENNLFALPRTFTARENQPLIIGVCHWS